MTQMIKIYHCTLCGKVLDLPSDQANTFEHSEFPGKIFHKCSKKGDTYGVVTIAGLKEIKEEEKVL